MNSVPPSPVFVPGYIYSAQTSSSNVKQDQSQSDGDGARKRTRYGK